MVFHNLKAEDLPANAVRNLSEFDEWAKKARELLGKHYLISGDEVDDAGIKALCEEYDRIVKNQNIRLC